VHNNTGKEYILWTAAKMTVNDICDYEVYIYFPSSNITSMSIH